VNGERQTGSTELPAAGLPAAELPPADAESSAAADVAREDQAEREADAALADFERSAVEDLASILSSDLAEIEHEDAPSDLEPGGAMIPREAASASVSPKVTALEGVGREVEMECPGCGLLVSGADPRPTAEWFCPRCDYPLFFMTQPAIPEVDGERRTARHRLPGVRGRTRTIAGACWNCGEWNEAGVTACLRCAATLPKPLPPQLGPFETVEVPEPELVEVEVMYWPPIVISVVGGFISGAAFLWGVILLMDRL
jgi:hypothetical protein